MVVDETTSTSSVGSAHPPASPQHCRSYGQYSFYRHEEVEEKWLSFHDANDGDQRKKKVLEPGTLCWVLQSKGKKQRGKTASDGNGPSEKQRKELLSRAWVVAEKDYDVETNGSNDNETSNADSTTSTNNSKNKRTSSSNKRRILVRYPKGSTYHVKPDNLLPVLMQSHMVVVLPETHLYRRFAVVHTRPNDAFCEIGCDVGILVHRIWEHSSCPEYVTGIDKAPQDIQQAQERYPELGQDQFRAWNVPLEEEDDDNDNKQLNKQPLPMDLFPQPEDHQNHQNDSENNNNNNVPTTTTTTNESLVIAIDINGTRELEAVQKCIQIVIQEWKPRLIVVKSRSLYADLMKGSG